MCIQNWENGLPVAASDWAISHSWWGKMLSSPPVWMSMEGAEQGGGHGGAFDMPAGVTFAPGGGPAHEVARVGLPEEKVGGVFFGGGFGGAAAGAVGELLDGVAGEPAVGGEAGDGVVDDAVGADVGVAVGDERLDHVR